jgi:hypothetical protein
VTFLHADTSEDHSAHLRVEVNGRWLAMISTGRPKVAVAKAILGRRWLERVAVRNSSKNVLGVVGK